MQAPPFRLQSAAAATLGVTEPCCASAAVEPVQLGGRARLADLDPHLHCSVIGTCLGTGELRKLMARYMEVDRASDLEVHHEAVRQISFEPEVAKGLHRALERRHEAAVRRFTRARDESSLAALWDEALRAGEVPGAYWAALTHRRITPELRQRIFGDVHMLSHLVGAANRADIRRLVALERDNEDLRERLERAGERHQGLLDERDEALRQVDAATRRQRDEAERRIAPGIANAEPWQALTAVQTARREAAERTVQAQQRELSRLAQELAHLRERSAELVRELAAAESQLQAQLQAPAQDAVGEAASQRLLYVGGRPSSVPAIREIVARAGGEFRRHDSALALKRDCQRQGRPFVALRSASVTSFVAALAAAPATGLSSAGLDGAPRPCLRHA